MRLYQIIIFCISCNIISAWENTERIRRQLKLTYDDIFQARLGKPSLSEWQDDLDVNMGEMLRRDLFRALQDMHKKDKEKEASGGGDSNNEGSSDSEDAPKEEEDPASSEHEEESSSQEMEVGLTCDDSDDQPESE